MAHRYAGIERISTNDYSLHTRFYGFTSNTRWLVYFLNPKGHAAA